MLEQIVLISWMTKAKLQLKQNDKPLARVPGKRLTKVFRARLYRASRTFHSENLAKGAGTRKSFLRAADINVASLAKRVAAAEKQIGPGWTKRLRQSKSYSGQTLKDTCESLSMVSMYNSVYRSQSLVAHGGDALDQMDHDDAGNVIVPLSPRVEDLGHTLNTATAFLLYGAQRVQTAKKGPDQAEIDRFHTILLGLGSTRRKRRPSREQHGGQSKFAATVESDHSPPRLRMDRLVGTLAQLRNWIARRAA